jgi:heme-degrading monooxygenase HmoA
MTTTPEGVARPPARQESKRVSQSVFDGSRLRVILLVDVLDGAQQRFLEVYEELSRQVASVPGHISDQLCQSIENPSQWLITSEWESAPPFLAWVNSEEHVRMVRPLHGCVRDTRSLRFHVVREVGGRAAAPAASAQRRFQESPRVGDGVIRHALTFTVKPGSEEEVAGILAGYASPDPRVDDTTRLCRTSLFLHGNRVVRAIEVRGDLLAALRHVARQPEVRAVEAAINPHLEQHRDLDDPESARVFFTRAALPAVHHVAAERGGETEGERHALYYPARPGLGMKLAELLAQQDERATETPDSPLLCSTIFQRGDIVVRLVDVRGPLEADPARALGLADAAQAEELTTLLDGADPAERDLARLIARARMRMLTDRQAPCD